MKKTAVITDAASTEFFFPLWKKYYGGIFGDMNLFVVTYSGLKSLFSDVRIGNVWELNSAYDDPLRAKIISHFVSLLLETYDVVLRCDIDEFLVPAPGSFPNLKDFVEANSLPYVTAHGVDVLEMTDELELDIERPILGKQRKVGILSSPLNKTALITTPVTWAPGFHAANVFPKFAKLYNFHLKYADIIGRKKWNDFMQSKVDANSRESKYFISSSQHLQQYQEKYSRLARVKLPDSIVFDDFERNFLNSVSFNPIHKIYQGHFKTSDSLVEIGSDFEGLI